MYSTIKISDEGTLIENKDILETFFNGLYIECFPNPVERENPSDIFERIEKAVRGVRTEITLIQVDSELCGGLILDKYVGTSYNELIYICIKKEYRGQGIGTELIKNLLEDNKEGYIFVECDKPEIDEGTSVIEPVRRLEWYNRLGFTILPFDYIMPPLTEEAPFYNDLYLLSSRPIDKEFLKDFITRFYFSLGAEESKELKIVIDNIENSKIL